MRARAHPASANSPDTKFSVIKRRLRKRILAKLDKYLGASSLGAIESVNVDSNLAALTFDDGPHPKWTPLVLKVLEKHGAKATFFMLGKQAAKHPELIRQVRQAGHVVGNHSWDHESFPLLRSSQRRQGLAACQATLGSHASDLFRPPYGDQDLASRFDVMRSGYKTILWDLPSQDWEGLDSEEIFNVVQSKLKPGAILLMHDRLHTTNHIDFADRCAMVEALEKILAENSDYRFVTVPELLEAGTPKGSFRAQVGDPEAFAKLVVMDE
ncbi:MAG: polysaccharide deacetylase family protein [Pseudomonadota bacterium]